jgi:hypothetical protein
MEPIELKRFGTLLLTREKGRSVSEALPTGRNALHLDLGGVEAASPSFLDELARALFEKGIRSIVVTGATDHIVENLERVSNQPSRAGVPRAIVELISV